MQPRHRMMGMLRRVAAAQQGATMVEFAFVMALFLLPLVVGAIDLGKGLWVMMQVGNSARAGAEFATDCHCADTVKIAGVVDQTIQNAEQGAAGLGTAVTTHSAQFCGCANSGSSVTVTFNDYTSILPGLSLPTGASVAVDPTPSTPLPACASDPAISYCSDGSKPGTFVTVTARATYTPLINYPGIVPQSGYFTMIRAATARIY
jgi:Flp pilus assembly protein TadG